MTPIYYITIIVQLLYEEILEMCLFYYCQPLGVVITVHHFGNMDESAHRPSSQSLYYGCMIQAIFCVHLCTMSPCKYVVAIMAHVHALGTGDMLRNTIFVYIIAIAIGTMYCSYREYGSGPQHASHLGLNIFVCHVFAQAYCWLDLAMCFATCTCDSIGQACTHASLAIIQPVQSTLGTADCGLITEVT